MEQAEQFFVVEMQGAGIAVDVLPPNPNRAGVYIESLALNRVELCLNGTLKAGRAMRLEVGDSVTLEGYTCPRSGKVTASGIKGDLIAVFEVTIP